MNIEPAWSRRAVFPPTDNWPLCNDPPADDAAWLYLPGDLEAWLMSPIDIFRHRFPVTGNNSGSAAFFALVNRD